MFKLSSKRLRCGITAAISMTFGHAVAKTYDFYKNKHLFILKHENFLSVESLLIGFPAAFIAGYYIGFPLYGFIAKVKPNPAETNPHK